MVANTAKDIVTPLAHKSETRFELSYHLKTSSSHHFLYYLGRSISSSFFLLPFPGVMVHYISLWTHCEFSLPKPEAQLIWAKSISSPFRLVTFCLTAMSKRESWLSTALLLSELFQWQWSEFKIPQSDCILHLLYSAVKWLSLVQKKRASSGVSCRCGRKTSSNVDVEAKPEQRPVPRENELLAPFL